MGRYRATICVDVWTETKEDAEDEVQKIVENLPNSFKASVSRMPHGSKMSFSDIGSADIG